MCSAFINLLLTPDPDFIEDAYLSALGRQSDPVGREHYGARLRKPGMRLAVLAEILSSSEAQRNQQLANDPLARVLVEIYRKVREYPIGKLRWKLLNRRFARQLTAVFSNAPQHSNSLIECRTGYAPPADKIGISMEQDSVADALLALTTRHHVLSSDVAALRASFSALRQDCLEWKTNEDRESRSTISRMSTSDSPTLEQVKQIVGLVTALETRLARMEIRWPDVERLSYLHIRSQSDLAAIRKRLLEVNTFASAPTADQVEIQGSSAPISDRLYTPAIQSTSASETVFSAHHIATDSEETSIHTFAKITNIEASTVGEENSSAGPTPPKEAAYKNKRKSSRRSRTR